ncbi:4-phosphoerythronate dehydrogenase [uncultured Psychrosphaera sp.]|uniref:4-phosphoerythronate dehydrogenase n=1 Tax=uncultured Psychrosphaera sp. TaxID=1403522 RepID=UPI0026137A1D|nr:4-phosphoerythronate dehydrogenase [uncultured Psychrosphaera sp.]
MNIFIDENIPYADDFFSDIGEITRFAGRELTAEQMTTADILLVRSITKVNQALLSKADKLSFVGTATIGEDHIDKTLLANKNVTFTSAPGCNAISVAEYVISSLYVLAEKYHFDLLTKTVAIIGVGNIGKSLQKKLMALDINLILCDPVREQTEDGFVSLDHALTHADVVTFHTPLTASGNHPSFHLLNEDNIQLLKQDVCLINASRGEVIDNQALLNEIHRRDKNQELTIKLVLDVWENEPNPLLELIEYTDIASAHIAGYSLEGKARGTEMLYQAVCQHLGLPIVKKLDELLPIPSVTKLVLNNQEQEVNQLKQVVHLVYDPRRDDALFRNLLAVKGFDWLRKNYPIRREWSSLKLERISNNEKGLNFLQIGFDV